MDSELPMKFRKWKPQARTNWPNCWIWMHCKAFRDNALNPEHPVTRGLAQNPDIYFQAREAANKFYEAIPDEVAAYMKEISKLTGREYNPFTYYGAADAENIVIAMGSITETLKEVVDYLNGKGRKSRTSFSSSLQTILGQVFHECTSQIG